MVRVICVLSIYYSNYSKAVYANVRLLLLQNFSDHVRLENVKLPFNIRIPHIYNLQTSKIHTSTYVWLPTSTAILYHAFSEVERRKNLSKYNFIIMVNQ